MNGEIEYLIKKMSRDFFDSDHHYDDDTDAVIPSKDLEPLRKLFAQPSSSHDELPRQEAQKQVALEISRLELPEKIQMTQKKRRLYN